MNYYSIISNSLFYLKDKEGLIKSYGDKLLLICDYLYTNTNRQGISIFTLNDIITIYYFITKTGKNKTNEQFKNIIVEMVNKKYITILTKDVDINNIKLNDMIRCKFSLLEMKDNKYIKFIQLFDAEKKKILNYKDDDNKVDNVKLLVYYCYLKCRMYKRSSEDGSMAMNGGKSETCYPSYERIASDINITENAIKRYNDILVSLDLIRIANAGLYYFKSDTNKKLYKSNNVYTLIMDGDEETAKTNLKESIKLYKLQHEEDRVFTNKQDYNNRKINGYKGRIKYLMEQGKATNKQMEKYNEILNAEKNTNNDVVVDDAEDTECVVKSLGNKKENYFTVNNDTWGQDAPINYNPLNDVDEVPEDYEYVEVPNADDLFLDDIDDTEFINSLKPRQQIEYYTDDEVDNYLENDLFNDIDVDKLSDWQKINYDIALDKYNSQDANMF